MTRLFPIPVSHAATSAAAFNVYCILVINTYSVSLLEPFLGKTGTNLLQKVYVPIINNRVCYVWHELKDIILELHDEMFCAGHEQGKMDACLVSIVTLLSAFIIYTRRNGSPYLPSVIFRDIFCLDLGYKENTVFLIVRLFRRVIPVVLWLSTTTGDGLWSASLRLDSAAQSTISRASITKSAKRSHGS